MDESLFFREIISRLFVEASSSGDVQRIKRRMTREWGRAAVPKNSEIFAAALAHERSALRPLLQVKPTRTLSGVAPVAVMTSPHPCPHGKCLPCPGGPDHPFRSPQSYTGEEPAALRGRQHAFDPLLQVQARLRQFAELGHHTDKVELIVMGGTITARDPAYQEWFMKGCIRAMNEAGGGGSGEQGERTFEELARAHESAPVRCVAVTFETRPDYCGQGEIDRMLGLGVTKVELGVQHLDEEILEMNRRGHGVAATVEANRLLRDAGLKVGFHVMPNLPGASLDDDRAMFARLFSDPLLRPDFLKIYPTLVTPGSEIEALFHRGEYAPYSEEEMVDLVAHAKSLLPEYVRLQRIQRDIPARLIVAGSRHSNFRQLAGQRLAEQGGVCRCIRCREIGRAAAGDRPEISEISFESCGGEEHFIQATAGEALIGFARLRFPGRPWREELTDAALLRELHVYGALVPLGAGAGEQEWQHRTWGGALLSRAEEIAVEAGFSTIAVMSGIGVRPYYRKRGYARSGPYMIRSLLE
jgi:elongator complex protein 3